MKTFFDIKNSPYNASGITNPNIWYWELTDVYYPSEVITEDKIHQIIREFIQENNLPKISLDEIPFHLMTDEQVEKTQWLVNTSFEIQDYWSKRYKEVQEQQQTYEYRKHQFGLVSKQSEYGRNIKIISNSDETKWMSITEEEFKSIREFLTGVRQTERKYYFLFGQDAVQAYREGTTTEEGKELSGIDALEYEIEENGCFYHAQKYDANIDHPSTLLGDADGICGYIMLEEEEYKKLV